MADIVINFKESWFMTKEFGNHKENFENLDKRAFSNFIEDLWKIYHDYPEHRVLLKNKSNLYPVTFNELNDKKQIKSTLFLMEDNDKSSILFYFNNVTEKQTICLVKDKETANEYAITDKSIIFLEKDNRYKKIIKIGNRFNVYIQKESYMFSNSNNEINIIKSKHGNLDSISSYLLGINRYGKEDGVLYVVHLKNCQIKKITIKNNQVEGFEMSDRALKELNSRHFKEILKSYDDKNIDSFNQKVKECNDFLNLLHDKKLSFDILSQSEIFNIIQYAFSEKMIVNYSNDLMPAFDNMMFEYNRVLENLDQILENTTRNISKEIAGNFLYTVEIKENMYNNIFHYINPTFLNDFRSNINKDEKFSLNIPHLLLKKQTI